MQCVLFDIGSMQELKLIYEDRADCLDEKTWMEVYRHAVKDKPFSFLYFNYKFPPGKRFYKRFEKMITTTDSSSVPDRKNIVGSANDSNMVSGKARKKSNPDKKDDGCTAKRRRVSHDKRNSDTETES